MSSRLSSVPLSGILLFSPTTLSHTTVPDFPAGSEWKMLEGKCDSALPNLELLCQLCHEPVVTGGCLRSQSLHMFNIHLDELVGTEWYREVSHNDLTVRGGEFYVDFLDPMDQWIKFQTSWPHSGNASMGIFHSGCF